MLASILGYQKWISPYKGFQCAHQALHGQGSCSNYGLRAFEQHSLVAAWWLLRGRLAECKLAYGTIVAMSSQEENKKKRRRDTGNRSRVCDAANACAFVPDFSGCLDPAACIPDSSTCSLDCGACSP